MVQERKTCVQQATLGSLERGATQRCRIRPPRYLHVWCDPCTGMKGKWSLFSWKGSPANPFSSHFERCSKEEYHSTSRTTRALFEWHPPILADKLLRLMPLAQNWEQGFSAGSTHQPQSHVYSAVKHVFRGKSKSYSLMPFDNHVAGRNEMYLRLYM